MWCGRSCTFNFNTCSTTRPARNWGRTLKNCMICGLPPGACGLPCRFLEITWTKRPGRHSIRACGEQGAFWVKCVTWMYSGKRRNATWIRSLQSAGMNWLRCRPSGRTPASGRVTGCWPTWTVNVTASLRILSANSWKRVRRIPRPSQTIPAYPGRAACGTLRP